MKKVIRVTLLDGTFQDMDGNKAEQGITSLGAPANHQLWLSIAQQICTLGVVEDGHNEAYACYIAPSQIKNVKIIFGEGKQEKKVAQFPPMSLSEEIELVTRPVTKTCTTVANTSFWKRFKRYLNG